MKVQIKFSVPLMLISILLIAFVLIGCNKDSTINEDSKVNENNIINKEDLNNKESNSSQEKKDDTVITIKDKAENNAELIKSASSPSKINLVKKTNKAKYLYTNGIEINQEVISSIMNDKRVDIVLPQVTGLVNKELEAKLNNSIKEDIESKVEKHILESRRGNLDYQYRVELNVNSILSIGLYEGYELPFTGFLYDLTNGKRVYLKEIFTKDTDYVPLINRKVSEGIIKTNEEEILKRPFDSIKPDQDFILSNSKLYIGFYRGESGFIEKTFIDIPLYTIDDYVNIMDLYSEPLSKNYEKTSLIQPINNIFITQKGEILKRENVLFWAYYPVISGLEDSAFEEVINNKIKEAVDEVFNDKSLGKLPQNPYYKEDATAKLSIYATFNHYGILSVSRSVSSYDIFQRLQYFDKVYTFDIEKNKVIDFKDMLKNYLEKNKKQQEIFVDLVYDKLETQSPEEYIKYKDISKAKLDYSFIIKNASIGFSMYGNMENSYIQIRFDKGAIKGFSTVSGCELQYNDIIKLTPKEFWNR